MENAWVLLTLALCTFANGELRQSVSATKMPWPEEFYLEQSENNEPIESGNWPVDDDDYDNSGSGSGSFETEIQMVTFNPPQMNPDIEPTGDAPRSVTMGVQPTTQKKIARKPVRTETTVDTPVKEEPKVIDDFVIEKPTINTDDDVSAEKHSESLFQRTEVLAAVIAGGVIGFLFAIFLILLLVYRMRKKDEGSYDLGERKPSTAAYQKAPTKEFYA
ncbi:syndecan-2 isoform X2 [Heterodontus francisci]|uniref:syndecan-2 isoform X2 n=1 Tax=Heterodontus francisci TaxID=7792 RepID=UPI00355ADB6C